MSTAGFFPILHFIGLTCNNCFWSLFPNCYSLFPYLVFKLFAYYMAHFQMSVYNSAYIFTMCIHIMKWTIRFLWYHLLFVSVYYEDNNESTFLNFQVISLTWVLVQRCLTCAVVLKKCISTMKLQTWAAFRDDVLLFQGKQGKYLKW